MLQTVKEPMTKPAGHVHKTNDYSMFKTLSGNRQTNLLHMKRLKESMSDVYLMSPIIVNEKRQIIDGQHRFQAARDLKLPVYYIVCEGYGLKEVQVLNANSKNWNADDFLDGYCDLGHEPYLMYREFKKRFGFPHQINLHLLYGDSNGEAVKAFHSGDLKIKHWDRAIDVAEKISLVGKYYEGYKRRGFVLAIVTLMKNKDFEFLEFLAKLKMQSAALVDCSDTTQYISLIENIYNYKRREKVALRIL